MLFINSLSEEQYKPHIEYTVDRGCENFGNTLWETISPYKYLFFKDYGSVCILTILGSNLLIGNF